MIVNHEKKLISLLDKKIELLLAYKSISDEIVISNIDIIADKFAKRQVLINQIDDLSGQIKLFVSNQGSEESEVLNKILSYNSNSIPDQSLTQIYDRSLKMQDILVEISNCELQIKEHLDNLKNQMLGAMKKSMDNKKIIDYYNTVTKKVLHGTNFDTLK